MTLAVKLLLAPALVVAVTPAARRWGPRVGGWLGGLPVVGGPILLVLALEQGDTFGADAAGATVAGLASLSAFMLVYASVAARARWPVALAAGWSAFAAGTAALAVLSVPLLAGLAITLATLGLSAALLPRGGDSPAPSPPRFDLALRALATLALVVTVAALADALGPELSGLVAPFPIVTAVLAAFTHAQAGPAAAARMMRGMTVGVLSFVAFALTAALAVDDLGTAAGFALATTVALSCHGVSFALMRP